MVRTYGYPAKKTISEQDKVKYRNTKRKGQKQQGAEGADQDERCMLEVWRS